MTSVSASAVLADRIDNVQLVAADEGVQLDVVPHEEWDAEASRFTDVSYDQTAVFAAARRGRHRVVACRVTARGMPIGGAVATRFGVPGLRSSLYYIKYGPVWRGGDDQPSWQRYGQVVRALRREFCENRASMMIVVPRPNPDYALREAQILEAEGFQADRSTPDPNRYLVDLKGSLDPLAALSQKWRYNLKKARKAGLTVAECDAETGYSEFAALHRAMLERKRIQTEDVVHVVPQLARTLPAELAPKVYIAYADGRPVAGAVVGQIGDMACYLYGASSKEGTARNAGYLVQWHIIEQLREKGPRWYDLGGEALEQGLRQFKRGLVGRQGEIFATPGEFRCWTRPEARLVGAAIHAARTTRLAMRTFAHRYK